MKRLVLIFGMFVVLGFGCNADKQKQNDDIPTIEANIYLNSPAEGHVITSPLVISGRARVFENVVAWKVLSVNRDILAEGFVMSDAKEMGLYGDFNDRIFIPAVETEDIILQIFTYSPMDGSQQDLEKNIVLENTEKVSVDVYFVDPDAAEFGDCTSVDFEKRTMAQTLNTAELAIEELLSGPTAPWATTMIPEFTSLESIDIKDGLATIELYSPDIMLWSGGSCRVMAIRTQIEKTLLQFDSVDSVKIVVNGESEEILQP
ncbi:GerMN domain-containing protein [Patescibacteria group bacterium]|nr:GerMN domain-containing protein [Patescibacteria group bacterium]